MHNLETAGHRDFSIIRGSDQLLEALWREHRPIMSYRFMSGCAVAPKPKPVPVEAEPVEKKEHHSQMEWVFSLLLNGVAADFMLDPAAIIESRRDPIYINARSVISVILQRRGWTYTEIGKYLGGRDHSTIRNLVNNGVIYEKRNKQVGQSLERWGHLADRNAKPV